MCTFPNSSFGVIAPNISPETRITPVPSCGTTVKTPDGSLFNPSGSLLLPPCRGARYLSHPEKSLPLNNCFHSAPVAQAAHRHTHRPAHRFIFVAVVFRRIVEAMGPAQSAKSM